MEKGGVAKATPPFFSRHSSGNFPSPRTSKRPFLSGMLDSETEAKIKRDRGENDYARARHLEAADHRIKFLWCHGGAAFLLSDEAVTNPHGLIHAEYDEKKDKNQLDAQDVSKLPRK